MDVNTLVIGAGQAGLATSYWLTEAGVEHLVVDGRDRPGGSWPDRWDGFHLVAPNFSVRLPGKHYSGPDPDGFMHRDEIDRYVADYATDIHAPVRLGTHVLRLAAIGDTFRAHTREVDINARNVVLATGPSQRPWHPEHAISGHIHQLHSARYCCPGQLPEGGVLVVGTGQSGTQIAEELHRAGREVHVAVSTCPAAPRRYRGRDTIWWLLQIHLHGADVGVPFPTVADLPSPAARFGCQPHVSGTDGGHDIDLRGLAREGVRLYGRLELAAGSSAQFSDDLATRLAAVERGFDIRFKPLLDAYITAAGIDAPPDDRPPPDNFVPPTRRELDLDDANIGTVLWATGYRLDFGWLDLPVLDEWGYPRHVRGVTEHPGLYAVGLPWLHSQPSSVLAGVGADAHHVVAHLSRREVGQPVS
jgi:putative flavoprotein involved in K+ transport